jgi:hypothetical protein
MKRTLHRKALAILRELAGGRAGQLEIPVPKAQGTITRALNSEHPFEVARDIAFHLTDWASDAAFIIAVTLFPERFTPKEIRDGVELFIAHAPNHVAAAAELGGFPVADIFGTGVVPARRRRRKRRPAKTG